MGKVQQINLSHQNIVATRNKLENEQAMLVSNDTIIRDSEIRREQSRDMQLALNRKSVQNVANNKRIPNNVAGLIKHALELERSRTIQNILAEEKNISIYSHRARMNKQNIEVFESRVRDLIIRYPEKCIDINDVKMTLVDHPNVEWEKTYLSHDNRGGNPTIHIFFKDLYLTPDINIYKNIVDKSFKLVPIEAIVYLRSNRVKLRPCSSEQLPSGYSSTRVHPHVLSGDEPCLGDFLNSVVITNQAFQFDALATVLQCFLEQAFNADDAGKHWPKWAIFSGQQSDPDNGVSAIDRCQYINISANGKTYSVYGRTYFPSDYDSRRYEIPVVRDGVTTWIVGSNRDLANGLTEMGLITVDKKKASPKKKKAAVPGPPPPAVDPADTTVW